MLGFWEFFFEIRNKKCPVLKGRCERFCQIYMFSLSDKIKYQLSYYIGRDYIVFVSLIKSKSSLFTSYRRQTCFIEPSENGIFIVK